MIGCGFSIQQEYMAQVMKFVVGAVKEGMMLGHACIEDLRLYRVLGGDIHFQGSLLKSPRETKASINVFLRWKRMVGTQQVCLL